MYTNKQPTNTPIKHAGTVTASKLSGVTPIGAVIAIIAAAIALVGLAQTAMLDAITDIDIARSGRTFALIAISAITGYTENAT